MIYQSRFSRSTCAALRQITITVFAVVMMLSVPVAGNAQETTSSIRGKVLDVSGSAVAGASIVVEDLRSGVDRSYSTNNSGLFLATRLLPGGPYRVTINGIKTVDIASINVGDIYNLTINLQTEAAIEEIITIGQTADLIAVAAGPAATFNLTDLQNSVSFGRDIADVYGIDPRLMIDVDEDGIGINCGGKHPRFNSTTLDGVSMADRFGLNENGYSTAVGMPFPYDAVEQIAVELAPFDVTYGGFSACIINAVTKSGTNDWKVKAFYEFSNQDLRGDTVAGDTTDHSRPSYDKTYIGFDIGGPLIKDKLFIFAAYEESDEPRFLAKGYAGSGSGQERDWLSQTDYDRIVSIANNIYNYDPGGQPGDGVQQTEKYMVRVDWNINDTHNAAFIYNYFDGFQLRDSDGDDDEFEFANHYYTKGAESETFTLKLSSQWSDAFSTEIFWSTNEMNDSQVTVGPKDFADTQISVGGFDGVVYLGADDSRQANKLGTQADYFKLSANYLLGNHVITAGYDQEDLEIFNIFVQHSAGGEYDYFDSSVGNPAFCDALTAQQRLDDPGCSLSGIDRFELGRPSRIYYGSGGGTNIATDAAANFNNALNALYIQDELFIDSMDLTIVAGLRYEFFDSSDAPKFNQTFADANGGLRNDVNIDGLDLLMPRFGITWGVRDDLTLRGGFGLYSGGNPNVWISNAWSNDGLSNAQFRFNYFDSATVLPGMADSLVLSDQMLPGFDVPQEMVDAVLAVSPTDANDSFLVLIDPNYEQPSEWKFAIGGTWDMPWADIKLDFDYLHTKGNDPAYYVDLSQSITGTTILGTPIYEYTNGRDNFMLTNSGASPKSDMLSFVLEKEFEFGLRMQFGYAWTQADDVVPMTSAVAGSNFDNVALLDINNPPAAKSNWVVPQRFTLGLFYNHTFFGDSPTYISLYGWANEGQPQSYVMTGGDLEGDGFFGRHLLYVPTGPSDPNVIFDPAFDQGAFFSWVAANGLAPGFTQRNQFNTGWSTTFNLSIRQDIPLGNNLRGTLYWKIKNLGNFLNDDWGKVTDAQFFSPAIINADVDGTTGQFIYSRFNDRSIERTYVNP
ncbi:MAG: TonB-dependent receptor, partial [Proteobacteria bacterium]|nr:TonB-dependent receptor [Pseudomonadota bacterium]